MSLALLGGGAAVTHRRAAHRERAAEDAYPPQGQMVTLDDEGGHRMHAVVAGQGPDLVLIHGASGSTRDFTSGLIPFLTEHYRVIAIDRPGFGWSQDHPDGINISTQARLIRATAAALGADKPIVLGQSYGGAVALAWAVETPDALSALVPVAAPSHPWSTGLTRFYAVTSHPLGLAVVVPLLTAFVPDPMVRNSVSGVFSPQEMPEGYVQEFGPRMSLRRFSMRTNARQRRALKSQIAAMWPRYDRINVPVESVHGAADTTVSPVIHAHRLAADVPLVNYTELPGIGHMPHHVAKDDVIEAIHRAAVRAGLR